MIKKILKSKVGMGAAAGILVVSLGLGATYAWFTAQAQTETTIAMGNLRIASNFEDINTTTYLPGGTASSEGSIKNTGSIAAVLSVKGESQIAFTYSDDDFNPWTGSEWVLDDKGAVITELSGPTSGWGEDSDNNLTYAWFINKSNPEDKYLLLAPQSELALSLDAEFNGDVMKNQYNDARVKIINDIRATQTYDGAMQSEFGLGFDDLELSMPESSDLTDSVTTVPQHILDQINAIFNQ